MCVAGDAEQSGVGAIAAPFVCALLVVGLRRWGRVGFGKREEKQKEEEEERFLHDAERMSLGWQIQLSLLQ